MANCFTCPHCSTEIVIEQLPQKVTVICAHCRQVAIDPTISIVRTSSKAIASLSLGIASVVLSFLAGIPAIVLGLLALREIRSSKTRIRGKSLAMAGIACGVLFGVLCAPILGLAAIPVLRMMRSQMLAGPPPVRPEQAHFFVQVPLAAVTPIADGQIASDEYGSTLTVTFDDDQNPGQLWALSAHQRKPAEDLSFELLAAHSAESLFLAFRVRDQVVQHDPHREIWNSDSVEVFLDGDRVANDFVPGNQQGSLEGFQLIADTEGRQLTHSVDFRNAAWNVSSSITGEGYIIEFEIPLSLVDTADGPTTVAATTGDEIWCNVLVNDHDRSIGDSDAILWAENRVRARPYHEGEAVWTVALQLE